MEEQDNVFVQTESQLVSQTTKTSSEPTKMSDSDGGPSTPKKIPSITSEWSKIEKKRTNRKLFCQEWLTKDEFKDWLEEVPRRSSEAKCVVCNVILASVKSELDKHMQEKEHIIKSKKIKGFNRHGHNRSSQRRSKKRLQIPRGWMDCPSIATVWVADKFVAFKTPLDYKYDRKIESKKRFKPEMVFSHVSSYQKSIGLWIDLTYFKRYPSRNYKKSEVENMGCDYVKIRCPGNEALPDEQIVDTFLDICNKFLSNNSSQLIGVHCTYGFNRTGFLIVSYLIKVLKYDVSDAIAAFATARPPGIGRKNYEDELYKLYPAKEDPTEAPKPD